MEEFREKFRIALEKAIVGRKEFMIGLDPMGVDTYYYGVAYGKIAGLELAIEILKEVK